ncbi:MAG: class I tRNA ligase family protein, partial [Patescibacteria group bacterium]
LVDEPNTYLIAWTTTPWTLPGNTALAINKDIIYVSYSVEENGKNNIYILSEESFKHFQEVGKSFSQSQTFGASLRSDLGKTFKGSELLGKKYKPLFSYYENVEMPNKENIWKIWHADFVTSEKGTGIAHQAPAFGEEDMSLAKKENIPWILHVDETGKFKPEVKDFAGLSVKPKSTEKDGHQKTDIEIIKYLAKSKLLFEKEKIVHPYPHCYRCETPIIYYALPSWFLNIQKVKDKIIEKAKTINWMPAYLKDGRFKNIVESAPDWNISRNRYWASPLPIWKCQKCEKNIFIGSLEELKNKTKKSGNNYFIMRHGEAENNVAKIFRKDSNNVSLTKKGKKQVLENIKNFQKETTSLTPQSFRKIDLIIASPYQRTKETIEIVREYLKIPTEKIIFEETIREWELSSSFEGKDKETISQYYDFDYIKNPKNKISDGESFADLVSRAGDFIYQIENSYQNKNILIVSHSGTGRALNFVAAGITFDDLPTRGDVTKLPSNGEIWPLFFTPLPHNRNYELDYHRPYIDQLKLICNECGSDINRVPEVLDCWFESGSMPFAQDHYPFENPAWLENNFPAGFVVEYIAQTRTWFYYTHVISTILFNHAPFKNIVTTGTLLAEDGQKISKSKGNFPDPWILFNKYGVDALRFYLLNSPLVNGEDANFSEKSVQEISNKIIGRLFNVVAFYELYPSTYLEVEPPLGGSTSKFNILDQWILLRLDQIINEINNEIKVYNIVEATRHIEVFIDDLSTWYLRCSRERIKEETDLEVVLPLGSPTSKSQSTRATLLFVLKTLVKIIAPFIPFTAEDIWQRLKKEGDEESVHLCDFPGESATAKSDIAVAEVISKMQKVREIVSRGFELRQKAGIKVRQPLAELRIKNYELGTQCPSLTPQYLEIIKSELNVKNISIDKNLVSEIELNTEITYELKLEGDYRELARSLQDLRKSQLNATGFRKLKPSDIICIQVETNDLGKELIKRFENELKKNILISEIEFVDNNGTEIKVDNLIWKVKVIHLEVEPPSDTIKQ